MALAFRFRTLRQVCGLGLGLIVLAFGSRPGYAQITPGSQVITTVPGTNVAQQTMAVSIASFCPPLNRASGLTPAQTDLKTICNAMIGNALQLQGGTPMNGAYGLDASQFMGALQSLNGGTELLVPTTQASIVQTTQTSRQTGAIEKRINELRNWTTGTVVAGTEAPQTGQMASLSTLEPGGPIVVAQNQAPALAYSVGPLGVFANGLGQFGSRDMTTTENGYSFNNAGFVVGADYRFTPQLVTGIAFGYTQSNTDFDISALSASGQSLSGNLLQGNIYATYAMTDAWYVNAIALFGGGNNDSRRHVVIPGTSNSLAPAMPVDRIATGSFGTRVEGATFATGYNLPFGPLLLTPIARFLYQHTGVSSFSEEGALGADLRYGSSSVNTVLSFLGADAQYALPTSFGVLFPIARFHWAHQYSPGNTAVSVAYSNDVTAGLISNFILPGTPTSTNYYDLGVGISLQLSANSSGFINYDSILGINHTSYNSFTAGIRMNF